MESPRVRVRTPEGREGTVDGDTWKYFPNNILVIFTSAGKPELVYMNAWKLEEIDGN